MHATNSDKSKQAFVDASLGVGFLIVASCRLLRAKVRLVCPSSNPPPRNSLSCLWVLGPLTCATSSNRPRSRAYHEALSAKDCGQRERFKTSGRFERKNAPKKYNEIYCGGLGGLRLAGMTSHQPLRSDPPANVVCQWQELRGEGSLHRFHR